MLEVQNLEVGGGGEGGRGGGRGGGGGGCNRVVAHSNSVFFRGGQGV